MVRSKRWWVRVFVAATLLRPALAAGQTPAATPPGDESVPTASFTPWQPRVELSYDAPSGCPDAAAASSQLPSTATDDGRPPDHHLLIKVVASRDGFRGWAELRPRTEGEGQPKGAPAFVRELAGSHCADIVSALVLSVTLHLEGSQPPDDAPGAGRGQREQPPDDKAVGSAARAAPDDLELDPGDTAELPDLDDPYHPEGAMRWAPFLVLGLTFRGGWAPSLDGAWNGSIGLKGLGDGFRGARVSAGPTGQMLDGTHEQFRHSWIGAATEICPYAARFEDGTVSVLPCFLGTIGHYDIDGSAQTSGLTVGALDVRVELDVQIRWFTIALQAGASFPVDPIVVVGEDGQEVFSQSVGVVGGVYVHFAPFEFFL